MEKEPLKGKILIPKDVYKKYSLQDIIQPTSDLYRVVIHQGEYPLIFFLLENLPKELKESNIKKLSECVDIIPTINSMNRTTIRTYSLLKREEEKELKGKDIVSYNYYTSNEEHTMAIEGSPDIKAYLIETTCSPVQYIYYAPKHSVLIFQLSFPLSKDYDKNRFVDVGRSFTIKIGS